MCALFGELKGEVLNASMLSKIPSAVSKLSKQEVDVEILRVGIIAELDAINLYEQLAAFTENEDLRKVLLEVAKEEKTHFGEFQALLLRLDKEQVEELEKGKKEVKELTER
jgi:rubrerythrin